MVLSALAEGLDPSGASRVFGHRQATITTWLTRAGEHAQTLHERSFRTLWLPHLQLDELRTRLRSNTRVLWLWLAIDPCTRDSSRPAVGSPHTEHGPSGVVASLLSFCAPSPSAAGEARAAARTRGQASSATLSAANSSHGSRKNPSTLDDARVAHLPLAVGFRLRARKIKCRCGVLSRGDW